MQIAWLIVAALAVLVLVLAVLLARARAASAASESPPSTTQGELDRLKSELDKSNETLRAAQEEVDRLNTRIGELSDATYVSSFDTGRAYKLLAVGSMEADGPSKGFGVIEDDSGNVRPFLTEQDVGDLAAGSSFKRSGGRLVALDSKTTDAEATAASTDGGEKPAQRTQMFRPPVESEPEDPTGGMPYLRIEVKEGTPTTHYLEFKTVTAGREDSNDIVIPDGASSRHHFDLVFTENRFRLRDNDSTNGTSCNGDPIKETWLEFGDEIKVGDTTMVYSCEGYDLRDSDAPQAVQALEKCIAKQPNFVPALKILAFLLERDIARKKEAVPIWDTIAKLEK